jgi:GH15 family glucan-1,4-alpha-glucosidase
MTMASIGEHGIIGNMRSAALVNVFGAIDFFCFPEFDSPSVFASLLDSERAGSFSIRPAGKPWKGRQIYLPETNVLTTRFISQNSILELCDWMPVGGEALPHCIMRLLTATHGDIEVELRCRPAFQYAGVEHTLELSGESAAFHAASTGLPGIRLRSSVGLRAEGGAAFASFRLREGESAYFILGDAQDEPVNELIPCVRGELQRTCAYWKQWAGKSVYEGRWRESVTRSALTLKLLTSAEHGSLVAAPTFGLPELIGGGRNWDYRYTWIAKSVLCTEVVTDTFRSIALGYPDFMELRSRTAHDQVLSSRIRRTEVRPICRRRAISDLLRPERRSLRI